MATNRAVRLVLSGALLSWAHVVNAREATSPDACQAAAKVAPISGMAAAVEEHPGDLRLKFSLADAWSETGCFEDAVRVLALATQQDRSSKEAATRLRVAQSVVGEERYFDKLNQADDDARFKRDNFRCSALFDVQACSEALRKQPNDLQLLTNEGDALLKANRTKEALTAYQRAAAVADDPHLLDEKISNAQLTPTTSEPPEESLKAVDRQAVGAPQTRVAHLAEPPATRPKTRHVATLPPLPRFSNLEAESQSH